MEEPATMCSKARPQDQLLAESARHCDTMARVEFRFLESVRRHHEGLQSFLSMRRIEARRRKASALWLRFSQSLARRRHRLSQPMVRSTIQRCGSTTKPLMLSGRLTIATDRLGKMLVIPSKKTGPA